MNAVSYETVFCPRFVPEIKNNSFSYPVAVIKICKPFVDTAFQAVAVTYIPGYGAYKSVDLVLKIVGAYHKSVFCLLGTCAKSFFPKKYIISLVGEKLGIKIPLTILLGRGVSNLAFQIVCVTITGSILPQKCIEAIEGVLPKTLQLFQVKRSQIDDDYVLVDFESDEDDYVLIEDSSLA